MKKNLLYVLALMASVMFFTGCSDDDDNSWKELPQGPITADKVELQLNGISTTGTVEFKATSLQSAEVGLKNVIDGYSDVKVDVTMEKQSDGSFKLSGTKEIDTKPVVATRAAAFLTVRIDGDITSDGKLTMNISTTGAGLFIGTYSDNTLVLSYGDNILTGKEVVFDATDGDNVSLLLKDVIPGEKETILTGASINANGFSGTTKSTNATVEYTGTLENKVLTLKLNVKMNDPKGWAKTYRVAEYTTGELTYNDYTNPNAVIAGAGYVNYVGVAEGMDFGTSYGAMFRGILGILLPQVLQSVTLGADGNVIASYNSGAIQFKSEWVFAAPTADVMKQIIPTQGWTQSPENLALWFAKDDKLYLKLNVPAIISQALGANADAVAPLISQILNGDAATIKGLISSLLKIDVSSVSDETFTVVLDWINNGIPLSVKVADGQTYLYLDKLAFEPLMVSRDTGEVDGWGDAVVKSDILILWDALSNSGVLPSEASLASMLIAPISSFWNVTEAFELGLDLQEVK